MFGYEKKIMFVVDNLNSDMQSNNEIYLALVKKGKTGVLKNCNLQKAKITKYSKFNDA